MGGGLEGVLEGVGEGHALGILGGRDDALGEGVLAGAGEPADQDEVLGRRHDQKESGAVSVWPFLAHVSLYL